MADKQPRRLPQWYLAAVNMATEVFSGNPQGATTSRPMMQATGGGKGISAQREGILPHTYPRAPATSDRATEGQPPRRNGLRPPPSATPLWAPPEVDADTPDKRKPGTQSTEV